MRTFFVSMMCLALCSFSEPVTGSEGLVSKSTTIEKGGFNCLKGHKHKKKSIFGSAYLRLEEGSDPIFIQQGPVIFNQKGPISDKVHYDQSTGTFTIKEHGTYEINYRSKVIFFEQEPLPIVDQAASYKQIFYRAHSDPLTMAVKVNGDSFGEIKLLPVCFPCPMPSDFSPFLVITDSETGQVVKKLSKGDTIQLSFIQIPSSYNAGFVSEEGGAEVVAYISFHKI